MTPKTLEPPTEYSPLQLSNHGSYPASGSFDTSTPADSSLPPQLQVIVLYLQLLQLTDLNLQPLH